MRKAGCLVAFVVLAALGGEFWVAYAIAHRFDEPLGVILAIIITSMIGWKITRAQFARLPLELMSGRAGQRMVGVLGGALLLLPGLVSDVLGLILLVPLVQRALAGVAGRLLQALMRQAMGQAGTSGFPGFPGATGGFPMFPGMMPKAGSALKPDEVARFGTPPLPPKGKAPRSYDTTAEKD